MVQRYSNGHLKDSTPNRPVDSNHQDATTRDSDHSPGRLPSSAKCKSAASRAASSGSSNVVPVRALTLALEACRDFLRSKEHLDIDEGPNKVNVASVLDVALLQALISIQSIL